MNLHIYCTQDGISCYPKHSHSYFEIIHYYKGEGYLYTDKGYIPFNPGTIIIVPPKTIHGSVSEMEFKNISIGGNFKNGLFFDEPITIEDNEDKDGETLAMLLLKNKNYNSMYINSLANAYIHFLLNRISLHKPINSVINEIIDIISEKFDDANINLTEIIGSYAYTKDYIRQQFKKATNMHPTEFLTKCRIEQSAFLIDVYRSTIPLSQIAEKCGYNDYVYFSKQFKKYIGLSPSMYLKSV